MTTVKSLAMIALLVGGTSLAIAQNGPPTGGQTPPPAAAGPPGPGVIPGAAPSSNLQAAAPTTRASSRTRIAHNQTRHPKKMFGEGHPPQTSKNQFTHADDAQAITSNWLKASDLRSGVRGFLISTVAFDF
jgi:hypothetical protein